MFFLPSSLLFFRLSCSTLFETVTTKEQEQKQVEFCLDWFWFWIFLVNTSFPGVFLFDSSFRVALSLFWKQRVNTGQRAEIGWKGKAEVPGLLVLILLFDFTLFYFRPDKRLRAGGMGTTIVQVQSKSALLSHPKQPFLFRLFSDLLSFLKYRCAFSALFSALFPAFVQLHHLRLSQPKNRNKNKSSFVWIGSQFEFSL